MTSPLVSIIIPVYNSQKYLSQCIESALGQTWKEKEIIVVDDGSSDNSFEIAKRFCGTQLKVIRQTNKGASNARNVGISASRGDYIQFLDADDFLSEDKIELQIRALNGSDEMLAICSTIHFWDGENPYISKPSLHEESYIYTTDNPVDFLIHLLGGFNFRGSMIQPNAWLAPRKLILRSGMWNEDLTVDDDGEFFARVVLNSRGLIKTPGNNYYRKFKNNKNLSVMEHERTYRSAHKAIMLKKEHLLTRTQKDEAYAAIFYQLKSLQIASYPKHRWLVDEIATQLCSLPKHKLKLHYESNLAQLIYNIFGWKALKQLQHLKRRIL